MWKFRTYDCRTTLVALHKVSVLHREGRGRPLYPGTLAPCAPCSAAVAHLGRFGSDSAVFRTSLKRQLEGRPIRA
jgi:hypothetical protein